MSEQAALPAFPQYPHTFGTRIGQKLAYMCPG